MFTVNLRIAAAVLVVALAGALGGAWVETLVPKFLPAPGVLVGGIVGMLLGWSLGFYLVHQQRRWMATAALATFLLFVFLQSGILTTLFTVAAIVVTFIVSAGVLRGFYNGSDIEAVKHHFIIWTSIRGGFVIIEDGKIVLPAKSGPHLGPKLIMVRPGNAVIMVNGGAITRICGPSTFLSQNFEYPSKVIGLERKHKTISMDDIITEHFDPVSIRLSYVIGIDVSEATFQGKNRNVLLPDNSSGLTAQEHETLQRVVTLYPEWEQEAHRTVQGTVRRLLGQIDATDLVNGCDYEKLGRRIELLAHDKLKTIGCRIELITVSSIALNTTLFDTYVDGVRTNMNTYIEGERIRNLEHAKGESLRMAITEVAVGYLEALRLGRGNIDVGDIHRMATRSMMEHMAQDPATKVILPTARYSLDDIQGAASIADNAVEE